MNEKFVSVIVPVYNSEKYLHRCVNSILTQKHQNIELILVDDGSKDSSPKICDEYAEKDRRVKVIHKENGGVSSARNRGMDIATGDYITFADSDDYWDDHILLLLLLCEMHPDADIAICGFAQENSHGEFVPYRQPGELHTFNRDEMIQNMLENKYYTCSVCDKLFRREIVEGVRWDESISHNEDLLFLYEVMKKCNIAAYTSDVGYNYCANEGSAVHSKFNRKKMTMIDVWDRIFQENPDKQYLRDQYVRVNIMCASQAAGDGYDNADDIWRLRANIRQHLVEFLGSKMALGYKVNAVLAVLNWRLFCKRVG